MNTTIYNKKVIIFCLSFLEVEWTLQLIEKNKPNNCIVITYNEAIMHLLAELYSSEMVFSTKGVQVPEIQKNIFKLGKKLILFYKQKREYTYMFQSISNCKVYFFFVAFGLFESYLILLLSKKNNIYYQPKVSIKSFSCDSSVQTKIYEHYIKLKIGVPIITLKSGDRIFRAVSDRFLYQINVNNFELPDNKNDVANLINQRFNLNKFRVLILVGFGESELQNKNEYIERYNNLILYFIEKYGNSSVAIKWHPNTDDNYIFDNKVFVIPKYIPGNLLIDKFQIFCGHVSSLLFEAANKDKISISTLNYCNIILTQEAFQGYFQNNLHDGKRIEYFDNLKSLDSLLLEKCKN